MNRVRELNIMKVMLPCLLYMMVLRNQKDVNHIRELSVMKDMLLFLITYL